MSDLPKYPRISVRVSREMKETLENLPGSEGSHVKAALRAYLGEPAQPVSARAWVEAVDAEHRKPKVETIHVSSGQGPKVKDRLSRF